jgi:chromosome segregation ATPase
MRYRLPDSLGAHRVALIHWPAIPGDLAEIVVNLGDESFPMNLPITVLVEEPDPLPSEPPLTSAHKERLLDFRDIVANIRRELEIANQTVSTLLGEKMELKYAYEQCEKQLASKKLELDSAYRTIDRKVQEAWRKERLKRQAGAVNMGTPVSLHREYQDRIRQLEELQRQWDAQDDGALVQARSAARVATEAANELHWQAADSWSRISRAWQLIADVESDQNQEF